jgi:hypothetical protein
MKFLTHLLAGALLLGGAGYTSEAAADRRLRCESSSGNQTWCAAETRHGVRLLRQYSRAPCYEGDTWGYSRRGIWVSNGCRAEFEVEERRGRSGDNNGAAALIGLALIGALIANDDEQDQPYRGDVVRCESNDNRTRRCDVNLRRAQVQVRRQLSNAQCSHGYSWGYDRRSIWVSHGCRADFQILRR